MEQVRPVLNKVDMYRRLSAGEFGNTVPQWFDVAEWAASAAAVYPLWGVRSLTVGGPCRLNCPRAEVAETARRFADAGHAVNVSVMIDVMLRVTLWADVYDSADGLLVYGIEYPPRGGSWRALMPSRGRERRGLAARLLLERHLNPTSLADLAALRDRLPGHVYEISALDRCFGTVPGRNAVVWECRAY